VREPEADFLLATKAREADGIVFHAQQWDLQRHLALALQQVDGPINGRHLVAAEDLPDQEPTVQDLTEPELRIVRRFQAVVDFRNFLAAGYTPQGPGGVCLDPAGWPTKLISEFGEFHGAVLGTAPLFPIPGRPANQGWGDFH
jgi:hypothetical protein